MPTCKKHGDPIMYTAKECPACEEATRLRFILDYRDKQIDGLICTVKHREHQEGNLRAVLALKNKIIGLMAGIFGKNGCPIDMEHEDLKLIKMFAENCPKINPATCWIKYFTAQAEKELADDR